VMIIRRKIACGNVDIKTMAEYVSVQGGKENESCASFVRSFVARSIGRNQEPGTKSY